MTGIDLENNEGVTIHRIGKDSLYSQRGNFIPRALFNHHLISELAILKPDIIDASGFVSFGGGYFGAKRIGCPCIATVHEVWNGEWIQHMGLVNGCVGSLLESRLLCSEFDGYISVSNFTRNKMITRLGLNPSKIVVIYNGVDLNYYRSIKESNQFQERTILTVTRLVNYKKVDLLIRAIKIIKDAGYPLKLKIVGKGPQEPFLIDLTNKLGLKKRYRIFREGKRY
jgi:Glycosyltransferase